MPRGASDMTARTSARQAVRSRPKRGAEKGVITCGLSRQKPHEIKDYWPIRTPRAANYDDGECFRKPTNFFT